MGRLQQGLNNWNDSLSPNSDKDGQSPISSTHNHGHQISDKSVEQDTSYLETRNFTSPSQTKEISVIETLVKINPKLNAEVLAHAKTLLLLLKKINLENQKMN